MEWRRLIYDWMYCEHAIQVHLSYYFPVISSTRTRLRLLWWALTSTSLFDNADGSYWPRPALCSVFRRFPGRAEPFSFDLYLQLMHDSSSLLDSKCASSAAASLLSCNGPMDNHPMTNLYHLYPTCQLQFTERIRVAVNENSSHWCFTIKAHFYI